MRKILFLFVIVFGFTPRSFSQVQGDVLDVKEAGIANAIIIATDSATRSVDTVKTDTRGFYSFDKLKPGKYRIEARAAGFQTVIIKDIIVKKEDTGKVEEEDLYAGQRLDITLVKASR
jgi:hypothetical protein